MGRAAEPARHQPPGQLPVAEVRREEDEAAPGGEGGVDVRFPLHGGEQPVGLRLPAVGAEQIGEAHGEAAEDAAHERLARRGAEPGRDAREVRPDHRALDGEGRHGGDRRREREPRAARQPAEHARAEPVYTRAVPVVRVPARGRVGERQRSSRSHGQPRHQSSREKYMRKARIAPGSVS